MHQQGDRQFEVRVEAGPGHGDLYELEQTTYYHIVDAHTGEIVLTFAGELSAGLSRDTGQWEDYEYGGVCEVILAADAPVALVRYYDGHAEMAALPQ